MWSRGLFPCGLLLRPLSRVSGCLRLLCGGRSWWGGGVLEAGGSPRVGSWCSLLGRCPGARVWVLAARSYVWSAVGGGGGSGTLLCLVLFGHKIRRGGVRAEKSSDLEQFVKEGVVFLE